MLGMMLLILFIVAALIYFFADSSEYPWLPYVTLLLFLAFIYIRYLEIRPHFAQLTARAKETLKSSGIESDMLDVETEQKPGRLKGKARKAKQKAAAASS
jgi:hypothetical protein